MLKKLLKYDLKDMYKVLIIFYSISIIFAILTRIFFNIENSTIFNILGYVASGTLISMIVNILINNILRVWASFIKNIYGDQSYLTHTLPLSKKTIYLSKVFSSVITMFTSVLVILIDVFIAYYGSELLTFIKDTLQIISSMYNSSITTLLLVVFFIFFLELVFALECGLTGIILGYRSNNKKILKSILYGFGYYTICQILILIMLYIASLFNSDIMNLFVTNSSINFSIIKTLLFVTVFVYIIYIIITYIINKKIFEKGVNVD